MQLTPEQEYAIASAGQDMVLYAAAGSGKTFALTEMVAHLIQTQDVSPENIVVVTFTEKAADELKERIVERLSIDRDDLADSPIGTIHAFATQLLRQYGRALPRDFIIWDDYRASLERNRIVHQELQSRLAKPSKDLAALMSEYGWRTLVRLISNQLAMRWKMQSLENSVSDAELWPAYLKLYREMQKAYSMHKRSHGALDFEDLEEESLHLLEDDSLCRQLQHRYRYIFIDEYQDVSPPQYQLIQRLYANGKNHLAIVGDPLQSIYRFRGAEAALFQQTQADLVEQGARHCELMHNFRTEAGLIDSLNMIFASVFGSEYHPMKSHQSDSIKGEVTLLNISKSRTLSERRELEAENIVAELKKQLAAGYRPEDIAILFRSRAAMPVYEAALEMAGIPYQSQQGEYLLEQPEIIEHLNVFRVLVNPQDEIAMAGVLRSSLVGLSDQALMEVRRKQGDLAEKDLWSAFQHWWSGLVAEAPYLKASEVAHRIFQRARERGYYKDGSARRCTKQWIAFLEWMEEIDPFELADLLEVVEGFREDGARIMTQQDEYENKEAVQLMTVHAAKGLEFPVVAVADLTTTIPSPRDPILIDANQGVGMRHLDPEAQGLRDQMVDTEGYTRVKEFIREQELQESRRLLYVACTRAKDLLILALDRNRKEKSPTWNKWLCEALTCDE